MFYLKKNDEYFVRFELGVIPVWTKNISEAKSYNDEIAYEIKRMCYKFDPDSDVISYIEVKMIEFTCNDLPIQTQQYLDVVEICNDCETIEENSFVSHLKDSLSNSCAVMHDKINDYYTDITFDSDVSVKFYESDYLKLCILNKEQSARVRKILG